MADPLGDEAAQRYGRSRLSNVADTMDGVLDPAQYLRKGRHEEWTLAMSGLQLARRADSLLSVAYSLQSQVLAWQQQQTATHYIRSVICTNLATLWHAPRPLEDW